MNFTVESFKSESLNRGLLRADYHDAHTAIVKFDNGDWVGVSRYHDEDYWVVDCAFRANGYPIFSNGVGSRVTASQVVDESHEAYSALESRRLHPAYRHR